MTLTERIRNAQTESDLLDCLDEIKEIDKEALRTGNPHTDQYAFILYLELGLREKQLNIKLFSKKEETKCFSF